MQRLLLILILFAGFSATAQENNVPAKNNTNTNGNTFNYNAVPDTVSIQKELENVREDGELYEERKPVQDQKARAKKVEDNRKMEVQQAPVSSSDTQAAPELKMQQQFQLNQMNSTHQYSRRSASPIEQLNMDQSVSYYKENAPESFESHFYTWLAGHYNVDLFPNLQAAALLQPENPEVKKQLAAYYIITNETQPALELIGQLKESGQLSKGQLAYAHDLLVSGYEDSYIVTHGFNDMLSAYYEQQQLDVRKDVQLVSLDFLQSAYYRSFLAEKGLVFPESTVIDTAYLAAFCELNAGQMIQLSMTLPKDYFAGMKDRLYPVGLTFAGPAAANDHFEKNKSLWFSDMTKEPATKTLNDSGDAWSANYLPMMITLKTQLQEAGETKQANVLNKAILSLGERNGMKDKVKKYTN